MPHTRDNRIGPTQLTRLRASVDATEASLARAHELIARSWRLLEPKPPGSSIHRNNGPARAFPSRPGGAVHGGRDLLSGRTQGHSVKYSFESVAAYLTHDETS